jgi:hypothetical protein
VPMTFHVGSLPRRARRRQNLFDPHGFHILATTINIRGESYRLKGRRQAGLLPSQEREGAVAQFSVAPVSDPPKARRPRSALAPLHPGPRKTEFWQGKRLYGWRNFRLELWGIFNRY